MPGMKVTLSAAMRARDVSRPQAEHEQAAQEAAERAGAPRPAGPPPRPRAAGDSGAGDSGAAGHPAGEQPAAGTRSHEDTGGRPVAIPKSTGGRPRRKRR